jgi:uncharacterized protein
MDDERATLNRLLALIRINVAVRDKLTIRAAYEPAQILANGVRVGDDCAAISDGDRYLLLAAEGMLESFVADDPWFAGYSAVMVNLSDVAAMGGYPLAVVDVLWTPDLAFSSLVWEGITAASRDYGVPIVGGHTTFTRDSRAHLAAAVLGRANKLITSFDAVPGDDLVMAVDLRGSYRRDKPFWNASVGTPAQQLRTDLRLLPEIAERGLSRAGKDISNGGIVGTVAMLIECSHVGAVLWLDRVPHPADSGLDRWIISFPSYGYLLSVAPQKTGIVTELFTKRGIACVPVGRITAEQSLVLCYGEAHEILEMSPRS